MMDINILNLYRELPKDTHVATKLFVETFLYKLYPYLQKIGNNIQCTLRNDESPENIMGIHKIFSVCVSQINKCHSLMFDIFKSEHEKQLPLLDSRQCTLERLSWCCSRLVTIEQRLVEQNKPMYNSFLDVSIFSTPMYFVNWIDQTFDILKNITNLVSNINKDSEKLFDEWKNKMIEHLSSLHTSIDELLLSAMTLCRHCLATDQYVIKVRCQVVLRETKSLFSNIIDGEIDNVFDSTVISLKIPIKPSNINVLIDVLKDALYVLETNTNTALLALLIHCFSYNTSPVDILKAHYNSNKGVCVCVLNNETEGQDSCSFVKEFDLYNERLLQIGSFAVSCSSDDKRILAVHSNLATLEALDPHLVPALIMSPESDHTTVLKNAWNREVLEIRDTVFLIVDPGAFSEKARQMMHQTLLEIIKENVYNNTKVCSVINIGCVVFDFFDVYNKYEPNAVNEPETMLTLLADLNKVQSECKVVSDLLSSGDDYVYNFEKSKLAKNITFQQILKRLKLLYTIINKINALHKPKDDNDLFEEEEMTIGGSDITHTVHFKNNETYVNSPRSNFARTAAGLTPSKVPLFKMTNHLKQKNTKDFTVQLDELCDVSEMKFLADRDSVTFFYSPLKKRRSIRRAVLDRKTLFNNENEKIDEPSMSHDKSFLNQSLDLQITEVLHRINDLTVTFSTRPRHQGNKTDCRRKLKGESTHKLNETITKFASHCPLDTECPQSDISLPTSNLSEPSNVTTLERLNDLDLVESKLSDLRIMRFETSL